MAIWGGRTWNLNDNDVLLMAALGDATQPSSCAASMPWPDPSATAVERQGRSIDPSLAKVARVACCLTASFPACKSNTIRTKTQPYEGNAEKSNRAAKI